MKKISIFFLFLTFTSVLNAQEFIDKSISQCEVFFDNGKWDIQATDIAKLDTLSKELFSDTCYRVRITAHTDNTGSNIANEKLSKKRAESIQNYFVFKGIDTSRINLMWRGEDDPISENETDLGKLKNRRATIILIRRIYLSQITSVVKNDSGQVIPNALVYMSSAHLSDSTVTDSVGSFTLKIPYKQPVVLEVTAKDHFYDRKFLNLGVFKVKISDFNIATVALHKKLKIKDLNFEGNLAVLIPASEPYLKILLRFMRMNPSYKIQIDGHVNAVGFAASVESFEYNLSLERAKMVYNYLVRSGISKDRMVFKAFANWEMLYPEARTDAQMTANRRVEIRVIAK